MIKQAPIALFVYNRPEHTKKTIQALQKNYFAIDSELFIYSDAAKTELDKAQVDKVRKLIANVSGFKKIVVIKREENWGLANSIIDGVTKVVNEYGKVIVLEDDLVTSPYFLTFMNNALNFYEGDSHIFTISGYSPPIRIPCKYKNDVYLTHRSSSWGWAVWKREWNSIHWEHSYYQAYISNKKLLKKFGKLGGTDRPKMLCSQLIGKVNSWAIRRGFTQFLQKKYTVFPKHTLVKNIGCDGSGVHCARNNNFNEINLKESFFPELTHDLEECKSINKNIYKFYSANVLTKIMKKVQKAFK